MSRLLLFNPENDLALAADTPHYTPPRAAIDLRRAGALLPMWWAQPGDYILVPDPAMVSATTRMKEQFGLHGTAVTRAPEGAEPQPWGWSRYTRNLFADAGVDTALLPTDSALDTIRRLSHRRTTVNIHRFLGVPPHLCPIEATTLYEARHAIDRFGKAVIKLPWSSSGRGILYSEQIPPHTLCQYIAGIIRRQGSALIEPHLPRLKDFAALFHCSDSHAEFRGLSAFATDRRGCYTGNIIAPQPAIARHIGIDLSETIERMQAALSHIIAPHYTGWLGVDMLSYTDSHGDTALAPCIEVNLRRTMGIAAMHIASRLESDGSDRTLRITPRTLLAGTVDLSPAGTDIALWC